MSKLRNPPTKQTKIFQENTKLIFGISGKPIMARYKKPLSNSVPIGARISNQIKDELDLISQRTKKTNSQLVRVFIRYGINLINTIFSNVNYPETKKSLLIEEFIQSWDHKFGTLQETI